MKLATRKPHKLRRILIALLVVLVVVGLWLGLRVGPEPMVSLDTDRAAVGRATSVEARFLEPVGGLGEVRLELSQGDRTEVLARDAFTAGSLLPFAGDRGTPESVLRATVGTGTVDWLSEGEVVLRAVASRRAGFLRSADDVVVERRLPVRLHPPRLELLSTQHYARQGGSGAVHYRVGETAVRSGVRAGGHESTGAPMPGGGPGERFVIYALPWDLADAAEVRVFAEDDAGNRVEQPFLDLFKPRPPRTGTISLSEAFLERVVPPIADRSPVVDATAPLLEQYLVINGELRRAELERLAELAQDSAPAPLWSGPFVQMANSGLQAGFAETRSYLWQGQPVDRQTHLGLDLAATARAPVPAPATGRVVAAGWMSLYGYAVVIDHGGGLMSLSGHLSSIDVAEGELVESGRIIGSSGATGLAGGDHLHLEIFVHGQSVDPVEWLDGKWIRDNITSKISF
ncbi:MAG TPA: M23 family metallopeptidase [Candidatus Sulfomarinibacteraceae bacterium]|nr:M23 family metallopeptidase [Candidatus Sulfomarinibacteraceae bacterium]